MHESVQKDDIINEIPTRNAFLSNVNLTIDKITKANLQRGTDDLNEGIRERERSQIFRTVKSEPTRGEAKGFFRQEHHKSKEKGLLDLSLRVEDEIDQGKHKSNGNRGDGFPSRVRGTIWSCGRIASSKKCLFNNLAVGKEGFKAVGEGSFNVTKKGVHFREINLFSKKCLTNVDCKRKQFSQCQW